MRRWRGIAVVCAVVGGLAGVFGGSSEQGGGSAPMGSVVAADPTWDCCAPW